MVIMERGLRSQLEAGGINVRQPIQVRTSIIGSSQYNFLCFGLDQSDKISDNGYVIFSSQTYSPNDEISLDKSSAKESTFQLNLISLPSHIQKLSFAITTNGQGLMRDINTCTVQIIQNGQTAFSFEITGKDFQNQNVIITINIYKKDDAWRVWAVANAFNFSGGLDKLIADYGGDVKKILSTQTGPRLVHEAEKPSSVPIETIVQKPPQSRPEPIVDNGSASGKNAEGFDRTDNDWV